VNQRLVVPIPDLWLVGVAVLLGKGTALAVEHAKGESKKGKAKIRLFLLPSGSGKWVLLAGATAIYGLASLQLTSQRRCYCLGLYQWERFGRMFS
jgi:hypothetical protein